MAMLEDYNMAKLLDLLIAERATRLFLEVGAQPLIDIPHESGIMSCTVDVQPFTRDKGWELVRSIASPQQIREFEQHSVLTFRYDYTVRGFKARVRVSASAPRNRFTLELQNIAHLAR